MKYPGILSLALSLFLVFGGFLATLRADDRPAAAHVPFRLLFNAYDGDPKRDSPEKFEFQVNTVDLRQPSEFLEIGNVIPKTEWKLTKFEYKTQRNPQTGESEDVSELTVTSTKSGQKVVLILNRVTDTNPPASVPAK